MADTTFFAKTAEAPMAETDEMHLVKFWTKARLQEAVERGPSLWHSMKAMQAEERHRRLDKERHRAILTIRRKPIQMKLPSRRLAAHTLKTVPSPVNQFLEAKEWDEILEEIDATYGEYHFDDGVLISTNGPSNPQRPRARPRWAAGVL